MNYKAIVILDNAYRYIAIERREEENALRRRNYDDAKKIIEACKYKIKDTK